MPYWCLWVWSRMLLMMALRVLLQAGQFAVSFTLSMILIKSLSVINWQPPWPEYVIILTRLSCWQHPNDRR